MTNKKWFGVILLVIVIIVGISMANKEPERTLVASGHPEWPPIMFRSGDTIDGAGPALVKKIFDELGVKTSFPYSGEWDEVQAKAKSGEVDVLVAAYKTTERETYMDYSEAYTTDPVALFVKKGKEFEFSKNEELVGKRGVGMVGDSYGQAFDDFANSAITLVRAKTADEAFKLLKEDKADYFIYSLYAGETELKAENAVADFAFLPNYVTEEKFYITISKKSPFVKYMPDVNRLIEKYKVDGTTTALIEGFSQ